MMVGLHDSDGTTFPNLALMKLAAWHRARGDEVEMYSALFGEYDRVYSSKVFTFTEANQYLPEDAVRGGTGYGLKVELEEGIEHTCPDYGLYGLDYSVGFLTRGCHRKCKFCVVPEKEGEIRAHADVEEFLRHREVVLLDNNVLAHDWGLEQIRKLGRLGVKVDFNQGLDVRLVDEGVAKLLAGLKWRSCVRFACDSQAAKVPLERAVGKLRAAGCKKPISVYMIVMEDVAEAHDRAEFMRGLDRQFKSVDPFAQPFIDVTGATQPSREQRAFARWVNHKAIFNSVRWEEYRGA